LTISWKSFALTKQEGRGLEAGPSGAARAPPRGRGGGGAGAGGIVPFGGESTRILLGAVKEVKDNGGGGAWIVGRWWLVGLCMGRHVGPRA